MLRVVFIILFSLLVNSDILWFLSFVLAFLYFVIKFNYHYWLGVVYSYKWIYLDSWGYYFILLLFLIFLLIYYLELNNHNLSFVYLGGFLFFSLLFLFVRKDTFRFLVFFETSFVFMFLMVMLWGHNPERIEALKYFLIYSMIGSLPIFLVMLMFITEENNEKRFVLFFNYFHQYIQISFKTHEDLVYRHYMYRHNLLDSRRFKAFQLRVLKWMANPYFFVLYDPLIGFDHINEKFTIQIFTLLLIFMVKFPLYGLHSWLPKAHVESPVFGSMLLAGILIKLRVFGIIRFKGSVFRYQRQVFEIPIIFFIYGCFRLIVVKMICRVQRDLKAFVAYSSVVHMALIIISILRARNLRMWGAVLMRFSHGLCSSALFLGVNSFYLIRRRRRLFLNRGFLTLLPILSMFWFFFISLNCSLPIGLNYFSEILLILAGVGYFWIGVFSFLFNIFFCGLYCICLYLYVSHGKRNLGYKYLYFFDIKNTYFLLFIFHLLPLYFYFAFFRRMPF